MKIRALFKKYWGYILAFVSSIVVSILIMMVGILISEPLPRWLGGDEILAVYGSGGRDHKGDTGYLYVVRGRITNKVFDFK